MTPLLLAALGAAHAASPCDAKALEREMINAPPQAMAEAFVRLAECDPARARKATATHMKRMAADQSSLPAIVAALRLGADDDIRAWIGEEVPDVRSRLVGKLGVACKEEPALVGAFFVRAYADLGPTFWDERWHRGLDDCRTPEIKELLTTALTSGAVARGSRNRTQFVSVLEVWARNLGVDAVPTLKSLLADPKDEEEATLLVNVFADVARVGNLEGKDEAAAKAAVDAIVELAPGLPPRALGRARDTLNSLGATDAASGLARWAFQDRYVDGVGYTYGVALIEDAACKNGQQRGKLWLGSITETGAVWVDQLEPKLEERLKSVWTPDVGSKCKGASTFAVELGAEPVADSVALKAWHDEVAKAFAEQMKGAQKTWTATEDAFAF